MKFKTLQMLFQEKNPNGKIFAYSKNGNLSEESTTGIIRFEVQFTEDGKMYVYQGIKTVYKMAERLNLIPNSNIDYVTESNECIDALLSGKMFSSIGGLHDTITDILYKRTGIRYTVEYDKTIDEYDRTVFIFKGLAISKWQ